MKAAFLLVLCLISFSAILAEKTSDAKQDSADASKELVADEGRTEGVVKIFDDATEYVSDARAARSRSSSRRRSLSRRRSSSRRRRRSGSSGLHEKPHSLAIKIVSLIGMTSILMKCLN